MTLVPQATIDAALGRLRRLAAWIRRAPRTAALGVAAPLCLAYLGYLSWVVVSQFETRHWDLPAEVYAAPLELYAGHAISQRDLIEYLRRLGYRETAVASEQGTFSPGRDAIHLVTRPFEFFEGPAKAHMATVAFTGDAIARVMDETGEPVSILRLPPPLLGSVFPSHGEDRLVVEPIEIPPLLPAALKAIEDQRFDNHNGVDLRGIARAAWVNLRAGAVEQGGSTLTQQLVKSYFLNSEQTLSRKLREAVMALILELAYDKQEIITAYINEVYLGQDGTRAIHGFGLASRFYFGKSLAELALHELALLVAELRGPSYYDPRRYPERARTRRDLVLQLMAERGIVAPEASAAAARQPLGIVEHQGSATTYYPAFMDLVRHQLRVEYREADLLTRGLSIFSTLDPIIQADAERQLAAGLERLETDRALTPQSLEGAVVVTSPQSAEVLALVGGRRSGFDGFNRALNARRPVGSLIKPAVYLAALETENYSLASLVDDAPIDVRLEDGRLWSPENYSGEAHGQVPLLRALSESYNMATVRLGMEVGPSHVSALLVRLGLDAAPPPYPSLLLGATEMTPVEVAQIYNSLANGGFRSPLRTVHAVLDAHGAPLHRYPLAIASASSPEAVYQLNQALVQVVERGTGRTARPLLPRELTVAGKTGTSDGFRDSWFAGFTGSHLAVVWVGFDDNAPTGFTGAAGALRIWAPLVAELRGSAPYRPPMPASLEETAIEYATGRLAAERCADVVHVAMPADAALEAKPGCGIQLRNIGRRIRGWVDRIAR